MPSFYSIKLPVFPFIKFSGVDSILGPEMKSTGEVMGIAKRFGQAYAKAQNRQKTACNFTPLLFIFTLQGKKQDLGVLTN